MTDECIFCGIAAHEVPSFAIYEDQDYMAFLDIFPNIEGMTVVIPKRHLGSYFFDMEDEESAGYMKVVKKVALMLEKGLGVKRVHLVFEGTGINHLHAKLYPAIGLEDKDKPVFAKEIVKFEAYEGYVTTLLGPRADDKELAGLKERIINANK